MTSNDQYDMVIHKEVVKVVLKVVEVLQHINQEVVRQWSSSNNNYYTSYT